MGLNTPPSRPSKKPNSPPKLKVSNRFAALTRDDSDGDSNSNSNSNSNPSSPYEHRSIPSTASIWSYEPLSPNRNTFDNISLLCFKVSQCWNVCVETACWNVCVETVLEVRVLKLRLKCVCWNCNSNVCCNCTWNVCVEIVCSDSKKLKIKKTTHKR